MEIAMLMNQTITAARQRGVLIIHAPSDCQGYYVNHPARYEVGGLCCA